MYQLNTLYLTDCVIEHLHAPIGIDVKHPRFGWKLNSDRHNTLQSSYRIQLFEGDYPAGDTGTIQSSQSIEVTVQGFEAKPMTAYLVSITVTDNYGRTALLDSRFETGRMGIPFKSSWVEPLQEPTPPSMVVGSHPSALKTGYKNGKRDFHEFRPAQYIRIPFHTGMGVKKARIYATAHGIYRLNINGFTPDERELAPEATAYKKLLMYQTYDVSAFIKNGENVIGVTLADGWWSGRVGTTGDCCQYGNTTALLLDAELEYMDGSTGYITANQGVSSSGPIIFSDLFVGEKYDASKELCGWELPGFDDSSWTPVIPKDYDKSHLLGQAHAPVRPLKIFHPTNIFTAPNGDTIIDAGQNLAGYTELTVTAPAGRTITLEHFEVLDKEGNYFNSILNDNKEQTDIYITKEGFQTYRPSFTYHGFRYIRLTGWLGKLSTDNFRIFALASEMNDIGSFHTSDARLNQLQSNIWWSQTANTISIPTDCPQREKAGWTGDIMAYSPTMCFNRNANAFLSAWMDNVRAEQLDSGAIPMIVPYLKAYATFLRDTLGTDTSCGWGDAVIVVPYSVYKAYGDYRILEDNYNAMTKWMEYIDERAKNHHPKGYPSWDDAHKARSRYLWNTDFHFGDWLIPSIVLGNPDANAMNDTAYATMDVVAPAYYAFSAKTMSEIAAILGRTEDSSRYAALYQNIRESFIKEYVHDDGALDADFQGIYVIALQMGLAPEDIRPKMVQHLVDLITENGNCLDTGFLSIPFLMDVLCNNGRQDIAYRLLFQTSCPSWLYEVNSGATTIWESWNAIETDGTASTYSYNHYAFGCIGEWMYRHLGGLAPIEPGYKKFRIAPHFDCGLTSAEVSEITPYGKAAVSWKLLNGYALIQIEVPANTTALIHIPGLDDITVGSGSYDYMVSVM